MAAPFIGEIRMFSGNYAPSGWALCDGQLLTINQNDRLFSLLGTIYGGDGETTFGLPDMRGRIPLHAGTAPGLSSRQIGSRGGSQENTLTAAQVRGHAHDLYGTTNPAGDTSPAGNLPGVAAGSNLYNTSAVGDTVNMDPRMIASGGGVASPQPHNNLMPSLCISFIIALFGVFPSPN